MLLGLILLVDYIVYPRATFRSIGLFGMLLLLAIIGTILCVAFDNGWLALDNPTLLTWIGVGALSTVLATGLSWPIVRRTI